MSQNQQDRAGKRQTWWQRNKRFLMIIGVVILVLLIAFGLAVYFFGWEWTGFISATGPTLQPNEQYRPTKTLWDVLQLLIIPIMLAISGFWLNQIQKNRELRNTIQQAELEREIAYYNQQETTLQSYLDRMSELLLKENLRTSNPNDEVRNIARVRTLTALCQLEANRNSYIFEFLRESKLISKDMS